MKNIFVSAYGADVELNETGLTVNSRNDIARNALGSDRVNLTLTDITGVTVTKRSMLVNGRLIIGTPWGKLQIFSSKKDQESGLFAIYSALIEAGVSEDKSVMDQALYSAPIEGLNETFEKLKMALDEQAQFEQRQVQTDFPSTSNSAPKAISLNISDGANRYEFSLDSQVFLAVIEAMVSQSENSFTTRWVQDGLDLDVVGESSYQREIERVSLSRVPQTQGSVYGFLVPEPENPFDSNAVSVFAIYQNGDELDALKVGYLPRDAAADAQTVCIEQLLTNQCVVPLELSVMGGVPKYPNFGIHAYAYTDLFDEFL